jgi:hypothetical protein
MRRRLVALSWLALVAGACATPSTGHPQAVTQAPNAPADRPVQLVAPSSKRPLETWRARLAPYVAQARVTYPDAKRRYLAGLPPGESFFVTTILVRDEAHFEQVFLLVDHIADGTITGHISSDVSTLRGFKSGDLYSCAEREIIDWVISKPDGSEEGNVVGKFLDGLRRAP